MKIRMKVQMSGTRNGEEWPARGEVTDLPTGEALHLVASGIAEEVSEAEPEEETATAPAPETSTPQDPEVTTVPEAEKRGTGRTAKPTGAKAADKE